MLVGVLVILQLDKLKQFQDVQASVEVFLFQMRVDNV